MSNWMHRVLADAAGVSGREVIPRIITVASPIAGADWAVSVPGGTVWVVQSVFANLQTSAAAGNRFPRLRVTDGTNIFAQVVTANAHAGASGYNYSWITGIGTYTDGTAGVGRTNGFPGAPILGGWVISTSTPNLDVADQWSAIALYVLEVEETPYDVEVLRDLANLAGKRADAVPQLGLE